MVEKIVTVRADRCVLHLLIPNFFEQSTQTKISKVFKLLFLNIWDSDNRNTMSILDDHFPEMVVDKKAVWDEASRTFQNEYVDPKRYTRKEAPAVRAKNDRLFGAVKSAKREYEKAGKVLDAYQAAKEKYL